MLAPLVLVPVAALAGLLQTSIFEWIYHRYWLHRPWLPPQMFTAHTLVHHQLCKHDDTFHVTEEEQEEALTFQWWAAPIIVGMNMLPWAIVALVRRDVATDPAWWTVMWTVGTVVLLYYFAYEGFHFLMHKPAIAWVEDRAFFRYLKNHHRLHHVYMGKNFNVVLPVADMIFGTYIARDPQPARATEPGAKQVARRHSRFGRQLREQQGTTTGTTGTTETTETTEQHETVGTGTGN